MTSPTTLRALVAVASAVVTAPRLAAQTAPRTYYAYVASESADEVSLVRFTPPATLTVEKVIPVGVWPTEMEGPHGVAVDPTGNEWYVSLGHGFPFGTLYKYHTGSDSLVGVVQLGLFPATVSVSPVGRLAYVVNANFFGEHVPSSVSVVDVETMTEVDRIQTCTMPHGSRLTADGTRQYSTCMMDDELVEIDARTVALGRTLDVGRGEARPHAASGPAPASRCTPTWGAPTPDGSRVYVMCNRTDEIVEVDTKGWTATRRWAAPRGPYNAEVTPDGARMVVSQKASGEVSVWDLASGNRLALIPTSRRVTHGVAITPDGRYAFVTAEGVGGEPGAVDMIDLTSFDKVASVEVGKQAGGIAFWR